MEIEEIDMYLLFELEVSLMKSVFEHISELSTSNSENEDRSNILLSELFISQLRKLLLNNLNYLAEIFIHSMLKIFI